MTDQNPLGETTELTSAREVHDLIASNDQVIVSMRNLISDRDMIELAYALVADRKDRAHRPVEAAGYLIQWKAEVDNGDRKRIQLTDEVEPWLARLNPTITPLGPLAASPPSRALSQDEREFSGLINAAVDDLSIGTHWHQGRTVDEDRLIDDAFQCGVETAADAIFAALQPEGEANG